VLCLAGETEALGQCAGRRVPPVSPLQTFASLKLSAEGQQQRRMKI
jgi:hypothetical protein